MATTEQRSGFRLPWAADTRPGAPVHDQTPPANPDSPPVAEGETIADPSSAEATEMQETTIPDTRSMGWPASDAGDAAAEGEDAPVAPSARPRRENLLVTGLVRAMRDAATSAREETAARFADEAKTRVETIHAQAAEETTDLRKQADAEIVEIRDWSKAEMARIREETDRRIADRKQHLEAEIERHAARVEHRIEGVQAAVAAFERQMETFFVKLMAEEDPARLAGLAEQLPDAPSLDLDDLDRAVADQAEPSFPMSALDARGAAAAEAEAFADLDASDMSDLSDDSDLQPDDEANVIADDDVARRLEAFTTHATAEGEGATSQLAVVGLVSVASIAGFKRALARTAGVRSVTVASGPSGDFIFSVGHDPETDLRSIVPELDGFAAVITGDADGVLTIAATDPESVH
ncbi:MAG: hypothetical protein EPO36_04635 [Chloroflexota bacterium]|nr:MAG: hypothetical protein EPO36_04635 [Chloroflexota bacterium]